MALLLLGGFRVLVDATHAELARRGYEDVRSGHEFAMRAIIAGANSASDLGSRLSVSKQAAAKTIAALQARGYVARTADPHDARRKRLEVTARGRELMRQGEAIFDELRGRWGRQIGDGELAKVEAALTLLVGASPVRPDAPGWVAFQPGEFGHPKE